jgi:hypothetical protein
VREKKFQCQQGQHRQHASVTTCGQEYLKIPETSGGQSKNSKTETVSIIANLPPLMITTPVDVGDEN